MKRLTGREQGDGRYAVEVFEEDIAEEIFCHVSFGLDPSEDPSAKLALSDQM
jgi:hypothetical protein